MLGIQVYKVENIYLRHAKAESRSNFVLDTFEMKIKPATTTMFVLPGPSGDFKNRNYSLTELNQIFSIDQYLTCSESQRIDFRLALIDCIKRLRKRKYKVGTMRPEDILSTGLKSENSTAIAISILKQKIEAAGYDELFHFRDTIRILRRQLLNELFGGKNIFYDLGEKRVGYDPNYVPFILGSRISQLEYKRKRKSN